MPGDARSRLVAALAALALVVLSVAAAPPAEAQRKKVLSIAAKEPDGLDPHASTIGQSQAISRFMYRSSASSARSSGRRARASASTSR
jgi:ABC-type oligopeptide transport system substrate-binding subunit